MLTTGSGSNPSMRVGAAFAATGGWDLSWTYDCANRQGQPTSFSTSVYDEATHNIVSKLPSVREHGAKGSGTLHEPDEPGSRYLVVDSYCQWTVTATTP